MKAKIVLWLGIILLTVAGCGLGLREAKLVDNGVSQQYMQEKFGKVTYSSVHFCIESEFNDLMRLHKESVIESTWSQEDKEKEFAVLNNMKFEKDRYLVYFFRLRSPALVSAKDVQIAFDDQKSTIIQLTVPMQNKVTIRTQYGSTVSYNYVWLMQLKKPFVVANYPKGTYGVTVTYPNSQKARYELTL